MRGRLLGHSCLLVLAAAVAASAADGGPNSLIDAVKNGNPTAVQDLLRHGNVNAPDEDGATPLHWAVYRDDLRTVDQLLVAGADVKAVNRYGITPLSLACINGNAAMIERLLKAGADANTTMAAGDTALMTAARTGSAAAVRVLIAHGARVDAKDSRMGQTALMWAAAENHAEVIQALLAAGADLHARSSGDGKFTPLLFAARAGQRDAARVLLDAGADVNETLVNTGATNGASALILAIASTQYEMASFLLDRGADPNANGHGWGWSALHQLEFTRRPPAGRHVIPFPVAAGTIDSLTLAQKLLDYGADPNAQMTKQPMRPFFGRWGNTYVGVSPFWLGAKLVDRPFMSLLLSYGADPLLPNADGTSPLMAAAGVDMYETGYEPGTEKEVIDSVKLCMELGNDVSAVNYNGDTALHGAAMRGNNPLVTMLVEAGAKLDIKNWRIENRGVTSEGGREGRDGGWSPWRVAQGIYQNGRNMARPETAALLARLMQERGLPVE
jgi:ankyrin repeat protein